MNEYLTEHYIVPILVLFIVIVNEDIGIIFSYLVQSYHLILIVTVFF